MAGKHVRTWALFGKVSFVLSVLWFFGLMFNFMLLSEFIFGVGLLFYDLISRFRKSHQTSSQQNTRQQQFLRVYDESAGGD